MKSVDFSETIEACDLKVGRYRQLNDLMRYVSIEGQGPKVVYVQKFKPNFLSNYWAILNQILYESFQVQGNENLLT